VQTTSMNVGGWCSGTLTILTDWS